MRSQDCRSKLLCTLLYQYQYLASYGVLSILEMAEKISESLLISLEKLWKPLLSAWGALKASDKCLDSRSYSPGFWSCQSHLQKRAQFTVNLLNNSFFADGTSSVWLEVSAKREVCVLKEDVILTTYDDHMSFTAPTALVVAIAVKDSNLMSLNHIVQPIHSCTRLHSSCAVLTDAVPSPMPALAHACPQLSDQQNISYSFKQDLFFLTSMR